MSALDHDFVTFLSSRGFAEADFRGLSPEQKIPLVTAYDNNRTGNNYDVFIMWLYLMDFI